MRPFRAADAIRAIKVSSWFPAHGAPVHLGIPQAIGIEDLAHPELGDPPEMKEDEFPVFWACGVTAAIGRAQRQPLAISHNPGCMLITNLLVEQLSLL
jgi:uncharacterized protein YcsI (UPF0317 family)